MRRVLIGASTLRDVINEATFEFGSVAPHRTEFLALPAMGSNLRERSVRCNLSTDLVVACAACT
jgi:hypothetical protein